MAFAACLYIAKSKLKLIELLENLVKSSYHKTSCLRIDNVVPNLKSLSFFLFSRNNIDYLLITCGATQCGVSCS